MHWEPLLFWPEEEVTRKLSELSYQPLLSIVVPTYNTNPRHLRRCIDSVVQQHYAHWELLIQDDGSTDPSVAEYLAECAAQDDRIKVAVSPTNGGISAASNLALQRAMGEFVIFLDHDDELHRSAALEIIRHLNLHPDHDLIYSDEDKLDANGCRCIPAFKPDFDLDIFLSANYLCHLSALRRSLALDLGGFRPACDGAQDWDLLLRAVEQIDPQTIGHIRKPLYHWRLHPQSTALTIDAKPYVRKAWLEVLSGHARRQRKTLAVEPTRQGIGLRLKLLPPEGARCAIFVQSEDGEFQIIAVQAVGECMRHTIYQLSGCCARPIDARAGAPLLTLSQVDANVFIFIARPLETLNHRFLEELAAQALRDDCGLATGISLDCERRCLHSGFVHLPGGGLVDFFAGLDISHPGYMGQLATVRTVAAISDRFFAVTRDHLLAVGGLSSIESNQLNRLVRKLSQQAHRNGLKIIVTPFALATFCSHGQKDPVTLDRKPAAAIVLNPNLAVFSDLRSIAEGVL